VGQRSQRVRETLGFRAIKDNKAGAERGARKATARVRAMLGGGVFRKSVVTLVAERLKAGIGPIYRRILEEFPAKFTTRILCIPGAEIVAYVDERQAGTTAETRERYRQSAAQYRRCLLIH